MQHEHWAVANLLIGRYGRHAAREAQARADAAVSAGDPEIRAIWRSVADALRPCGASSTFSGGMDDRFGR